MMKNRESINKVIMLQKFEKTKRSFRVYKVFKHIRREMIIEFENDPHDLEVKKNIKDLVKESF